MSKRILPLTLRMVDELQVVLGAMELGDYEASLRAVDRTHNITKQMRAEIVAVIEERHQKELTVIKHLREDLSKQRGILEPREKK